MDDSNRPFGLVFIVSVLSILILTLAVAIWFLSRTYFNTRPSEIERDEETIRDSLNNSSVDEDTLKLPTIEQILKKEERSGENLRPVVLKYPFAGPNSPVRKTV